MSRRSFLKACAQVGAAGAGLAAAGGALAGCGTPSEILSGERVIVDDIDRQITIPSVSSLHTVYFTSPLAQVFCLTMAPDLIGGTCTPFTEEQLEYLPQGTEKLMFMGSLSNGGSIDVDALKMNDVQVIFSISGTDLTDVNINDALSLQEASGIPAVLIDGSFDRIASSYRLLGECLGRRERAEELAEYCQRIYNDVRTAVDSVPEAERVTYLFAEGPEGLQTEPNVSQHSIAFLTAGGVNVAADVDPDEEGRRAGINDNRNMVNVTMDEIRKWDPQYIITWDYSVRRGASDLIGSLDDWAGVAAVRNGNVHVMPNLPFAFCDRPPGVNRFLGIQWLANLFYPRYYDVDMVEVVRDFYSTCYWREISKEQAQKILAT